MTGKQLTPWNRIFPLVSVLFIFVFAAPLQSQVASAHVVINFSARITYIAQPSSNEALQDFLLKYGLHTEPSPPDRGNNLEIPIAGSYSYDVPQFDQEPAIGTAMFTLNNFFINDVPLPLKPFPFSRLQIDFSGGQTEYFVQIAGPGNVGVTFLQLRLLLPPGTLKEELPSDIDFFSKATNTLALASGWSFQYWIQPDGISFSGFLGEMLWDDAGLPPSTSTCPATPQVILLPGLFGQQYMQAMFKAPNNLSLADYAARCNFSYFNWQQVITTLHRGTPVRPNNPKPLIASGNVVTDDNSDPRTCADFWKGCSLVAPPPIYDPPQGGYEYQIDNGVPYDPYPFYYLSNLTPGTCISKCAYTKFNVPAAYIVSPDGTTISFLDAPTAGCIDDLCIAFQTKLVGVSTQRIAGSVSCGLGDPRYCMTLFSWTWSSTFNGTAGSIKQTSSAYPIDPGSGTGGVTITGINGVQLPPVVSPSQISVTASGLTYSRVSQTFSGSLFLKNIGNSSITGPLQILLTGMQQGASLTNSTSNLSGIPLLTVPAALEPGQSVTVPIQLKNSSNAAMTVTATVYSGSIN